LHRRDLSRRGAGRRNGRRGGERIRVAGRPRQRRSARASRSCIEPPRPVIACDELPGLLGRVDAGQPVKDVHSRTPCAADAA